jgi:hypothetical protein
VNIGLRVGAVVPRSALDGDDMGAPDGCRAGEVTLLLKAAAMDCIFLLIRRVHFAKQISSADKTVRLVVTSEA